MIVVCPKCSTQLQVNESQASKIRCPKCNTTIEAGTASPASEKSGLSVGQSPSTEQRRFRARGPAPLFQLERNEKEPPSHTSAVEEMSRILSTVLGQTGKTKSIAPEARPSWNPRKALICTAEQHRESIARQLAQDGFRVFVAQNTGQAIDRMRENQLDVVLLDHEFDSAEQGSAFVIREVNILRPAERRRLFFVMLSPVLRTMDAHGAFLHNVNAIVNLRDLEELSSLLAHSLREYNDLYKELHLALNATAL